MHRLLTMGLLAVAFIAWGVVGQAQVINELRYDDDLTDDMEFCEIKGDPGLVLDGYELVGINGSNGLVYRTVDLTGNVIPADGYFVVGMATVPNVDLVDAGAWQNGSPDAVELRFQGATVDGVCYEGTTNLTCEGGTSAPEPNPVNNESISRCPDGTDTNNNAADFLAGPATPGVTNDCGGPPPPLDVTVCDLKENDADGVPVLLGQRVRITDVIALVSSGVFRAPGAGLLTHVYQETGEMQIDACCIALFDSSWPDLTNPVNEGDLIAEIVGTVAFFNGLTEISFIESLVIAGPAGTPPPYQIDSTTLNTQGEIYESCLIEICGLILDDPLAWPADGSNATLNVTDAFGSTQMFIDRDTDIDGSPVPTEPFTVTGVASQYDNALPYFEGYQIIPRRRAEILDDTSCPVPTKEQSWGQIKGLYR